MSPGDFLHKSAETPLIACCSAAGSVLRLATNSPRLLECALRTFTPVLGVPAQIDFSIRLWIDDSHSSQRPWPKPYLRGLDHLVFAAFDDESSLVADLRQRRVIGRFSAGMASDDTYWKTNIFPMLLSIIAGSLGLVELHGCCVAADQRGLILIGPTGSGKSTLALALTHAGLRFLSDDRTFCSFNQGRLLAWAMPRPLKLRPTAAQWFDQFRGREPTDVQNGQHVFLCHPTGENGHGRISSCEPQAVIFLDRNQTPGYCLTRISGAEALRRIEPDLLAESPGAIDSQARVIERLAKLPCWNLRFGGMPQAICDRLINDLLPLTAFNGLRCDGERYEQSTAL